MQSILQHNGWDAHETLNEQLRVPWDWTDFDDGVLVAYCWPDPETETPGPWQLAR